MLGSVHVVIDGHMVIMPCKQIPLPSHRPAVVDTEPSPQEAAAQTVDEL